MLSCDYKPTKPITDTRPEIIKLTIDSIWNVGSSKEKIVELRVNDPQGAHDIDSVYMTVKNLSGEILFVKSLLDDGGVSGSTDILAGDGAFRNVIKPADVSREIGEYFLSFRPLIKEEIVRKNFLRM